MINKYVGEVRGILLSLFPGADLLSRPFEDLGWCILRGPD